MYTSLKIENFRCFAQLEIDHLARINLIAGKNNTGKTSLLEAVYTLDLPQYFDLTLLLRSRPEAKLEHPQDLTALFSTVEHKPVVLTGSVVDPSTNRTRTHCVQISQRRFSEDLQESDAFRRLMLAAADQSILQFAYQFDDVVKMHYSTLNGRVNTLTEQGRPKQWTAFALASGAISPRSTDAARLGELLKVDVEQYEAELLRLIRLIDPRVKGIRSLARGDVVIIHVQFEGSKTMQPITLLGAGLQRFISLMLALWSAQNGVVLIDEIENGLHYSVQVDVWKAIAKAAREFNVQVFATTHSREMIEAAQQAFSGGSASEFRYLRLDRSKKTGDIIAVPYGSETLEAALEMDAEVR